MILFKSKAQAFLTNRKTVSISKSCFDDNAYVIQPTDTDLITGIIMVLCWMSVRSGEETTGRTDRGRRDRKKSPGEIQNFGIRS